MRYLHTLDPEYIREMEEEELRELEEYERAEELLREDMEMEKYYEGR